MLDTAASLLPGNVCVGARSGPVRGPEREVVAQELHDERRVLVALLVQRVQLSDGVVEGLAKTTVPNRIPIRLFELKPHMQGAVHN